MSNHHCSIKEVHEKNLNLWGYGRDIITGHKKDSFEIADASTQPSQIDGDAATINTLSPNRVRVASKDAATQEVRRQIAQGEIQAPPIAADEGEG